MKTNTAEDHSGSWHSQASHFTTEAPESIAPPRVRHNTQPGNCFRLRPCGKRLQWLGVTAAALAFAVNLAPAQTTISVISGAAGSYTGVPQSFNETRAVDVTVLSPVDLLVESMTLDGFSGRGVASSAFLGARIYDTTTESLIASASITTSTAGAVTIPISATLVSGDEYRIGFFAATTPPNNGVGTLFLPSTFPYTESSGLLQINGAYDIATDSFPSNTNLADPLVSLQVVAVPEPGTMAMLGIGLLGALGFRRGLRRQGR